MAFEILNIGLVELNIVSGDKAQNIASVEESMKSVPGNVDLVALPELFSTGSISTDSALKELAERNTENTIRNIQDLAKANSCAIAGSFFAHTAGTQYNRAFFVEPNGDDTFYDKKHLFTMGGEKDVYTAGYRNSPIIRFRGWNIKPIICYDLRFPVYCRNVNNEYDVLLVVANWPKARHSAWRSLLIARAIENCCYVCGVNRCGVDESGVDYGFGSSVIVDYKGNVIAETSESSPMAFASFYKEKLTNFRAKFPVWKDADEFEMK